MARPKDENYDGKKETILKAAARVFAEKGFLRTNIIDIGEASGASKSRMYHYFESKEALAAAVMVRLLAQTRAAFDAIPRDRPALGRLDALLRWTLSARLSGSVPHLPSTSPALQASLLANRDYMDGLLSLSEEIGEMIRRARADGAIRPGLRDEFVLYTLYARTCDPTLDFLKAGGSMTDAEIVDQMVTACFGGLAA